MRLAWLLLLTGACQERMPEAECQALRGQAYELGYAPQTCMEDADCVPSEWPGCPRPLNDAGLAAIAPMHERFARGGCDEPDAGCAAPPEAYCDRNMCIFRVRAAAPPLE